MYQFNVAQINGFSPYGYAGESASSFAEYGHAGAVVGWIEQNCSLTINATFAAPMIVSGALGSFATAGYINGSFASGTIVFVEKGCFINITNY